MHKTLVLAAFLVGCKHHASGPAVTDAELDLPLRKQVSLMVERALGAEALTDGYLGRIAMRDGGESGLRSVLSLDPDATRTARAIDDLQGDAALLGAVILVKDNIDTKGLATTAGSLAMANNIPTEDATVVARLREAHAVLLGKTNLSEWANIRGEHSTSGWSSLGGQTKHPRDPARNPCGSSSGSAVAVASGLCSGALGTETDGSIVCPAAVNGVVGFKPTVGLVSRTGVIPISHSQDTVGPITKNVADAARLLSVMAGPDPSDAATLAIPPDLSLDFEARLQDASLAGARLGVVDSLTGYDPALDAVFAAEVERLAAAGAVIVHVTLPTDDLYADDELQILLSELKVDLNAYLASHATEGQPATLAELVAYDIAHAAEVMPHFQQELFEQAAATTGLEDPAYQEARVRARRVTLEEGLQAVMEAEDLLAFVAPTTGQAWLTDYQNGDDFSGSASGIPAVAGAPHLTVPMGEVNGLPVGLSIFAAPWDDETVLGLGYAYERLAR